MLILFLVLVTLGATTSNPYDTRSTAAATALKNAQAAALQKQQAASRGQVNNDEYAGQPNFANEGPEVQNTGMPSRGQHPLPNNPNPNNPNEAAYAAINPNGYSTINIGNGSGKKNTVILNHGNDENDDELYVGLDKNNQYNPDVHGIPYNNDGTSPCYQNGVLINGYPCTNAAPQSHNPKRYNIGNGYNNENVVTINGGGRSHASRGSPGGNKQNKPTYNIPANQQHSQGNGIKAVYIYIITLMFAHMMM